MSSYVNKQNSVWFVERKHNSHIVVDAKAPQTLQLSRQSVGLQPRIEGILLKDRDSIPET